MTSMHVHMHARTCARTGTHTVPIICMYTHNRDRAIIGMKKFSTMDRSMTFTA